MTKPEPGHFLSQNPPLPLTFPEKTHSAESFDLAQIVEDQNLKGRDSYPRGSIGPELEEYDIGGNALRERARRGL
ncbi:hypothetical protein [Pseudophaeobacter sp.]|uniref:hypothetical protein n=1 Tax=Pseudophaeobacter sp. TaxID=1971739 RepID=UPI003297FF0E